MNNFHTLSRKLITALNTKGYKLTLSNRQFFGREGKPHCYYILNNAEWNDVTGKYENTELYSSASMLRIVFYLRDMWYKLNGMELPTDQEQWNDIRYRLEAKENG